MHEVRQLEISVPRRMEEVLGRSGIFSINSRLKLNEGNTAFPFSFARAKRKRRNLEMKIVECLKRNLFYSNISHNNSWFSLNIFLFKLFPRKKIVYDDLNMEILKIENVFFHEFLFSCPAFAIIFIIFPILIICKYFSHRLNWFCIERDLWIFRENPSDFANSLSMSGAMKCVLVEVLGNGFLV